MLSPISKRTYSTNIEHYWQKLIGQVLYQCPNADTYISFSTPILNLATVDPFDTFFCPFLTQSLFWVKLVVGTSYESRIAGAELGIFLGDIVNCFLYLSILQMRKTM